MLFSDLKPAVQDFFIPHIYIEEFKENIFLYTNGDEKQAKEHWTYQGVRTPSCKSIWLVYDNLPIAISNLFIACSVSDILCFCHYYPNWVTSNSSSAFASLGLLPCKEQFLYLRRYFPNAKIHTLFDKTISGHVMDCRVATWQLDLSAKFWFEGNEMKFQCMRKHFKIHCDIFSLHQFERSISKQSGIRTHKPKKPWGTFYQSLNNRVRSNR